MTKILYGTIHTKGRKTLITYLYKKGKTLIKFWFENFPILYISAKICIYNLF